MADDAPSRQSEAPARQAGGRASARAKARATGTPPARVPRAERRPEMIKKKQAQRSVEYQKQQRDWMITKIAMAAFAVLVVGAIGFLVVRGVQDRALNVIPEGVQTFSNLIAQHTTEAVAYGEVPPVGGEHDPAWQNCGYYSAPVRSENAVHSLEHGAVWITYDPTLPTDQVEVLRQKADEPYILVSPFEGLPSPVVASSWGNQLQLESASDVRLDQFIRSFRSGPDAPEPGAACFGGTGTPE